MKPWLATLLGLALVAGTARAQVVHAPENVNAEPSTPRSQEMATRAAIAEMQGDPRGAIQHADRGITADPADPWPYYNKGSALTTLGQTDEAVASFAQAEQRFAPNDRWGQSVAIFGRARALSQAGRCSDARRVFNEYATLMRDDPAAASLAHRYAGQCIPAAGPR